MKRHFVFLFLLGSMIAGAFPAHAGNQQRPEDTRTAQQYQADCDAGIALSSCGPIPISTDCPPDKHWMQTGAELAHCVLNDMNCPQGSMLQHDQSGIPSCQPIICPAGTVLNGAQCLPDARDPLQNTKPALSFNGMAFGSYSYPGKKMVEAINVPPSSIYTTISMIFNTTNGSWLISSSYPINPAGCCAPIWTPDTGSWASQPVGTYQYRITSMVYGPYSAWLVGQPYNINDGIIHWTGITTYPAGPSGWTDLPARSLVAVAGIYMDMINGCSYVTTAHAPLDVRFTLQLRDVAQPGKISTTVFDLVFQTAGNVSCNVDG